MKTLTLNLAKVAPVLLIAALSACKPAKEIEPEIDSSQAMHSEIKPAFIDTLPDDPKIADAIENLDAPIVNKPHPAEALTDESAMVDVPAEPKLYGLEAAKVEWEKISTYKKEGWTIAALRNLGEGQMIVETHEIKNPANHRNYLLVHSEDEWVVEGSTHSNTK